MNRINGYIILDDLIRKEKIEIEEFSSSVGNISEEKLRFWFQINNKRIFFKLCDGNEFNELIAEEILKILGIPSAHYDLAIFNGIKGVISYDYKEIGTKYINGYTILKEYYDYLKNNDKFEELLPGEKIPFLNEKSLYFYNRLDIIWDALYYHYRDKENVYEIVKKIMQQLVVKRNIDLLLVNNEDHPFNWEIMEKGENISLSLYFDNTEFFENDEILLQTTYGKNNTIKEDLEEYLKLSSEENIQEFIYLYNKIDDILLSKAINKAMERTGHQPQNEKIKRILEVFKENRNIIKKVLDNYHKRRGLGD